MALDIFDDESEDFEITHREGNSTLIGEYTRLSEFFGCCGNAILHEMPLSKEETEEITGIVKEILISNQEEEYGFGAVFCTVTEERKVKWLQESGWGLLCDHLNYGTGNTIYTLRLV